MNEKSKENEKCVSKVSEIFLLRFAFFKVEYEPQLNNCILT